MYCRYDAFISFVWKDLARARRLNDYLSSRGYITWYAEKELRAGDSVAQELWNGLAHARYVFVIHTKHYGNSRWAGHELSLAVTDEVSSGVKKIVVLRYDGAPISYGLHGKLYVDFADQRRKPFERLTALLDESSDGVIRGVAKVMRESIDTNVIRECAHRLSGFARFRREHQAVHEVADILFSEPSHYQVADSAAWALWDIAVWATEREFVDGIKSIVTKVVTTGNPLLVDKMAFACGQIATLADDKGLRQWARDFISKNAASDEPSVRDPFAFTVNRIRDILPPD